VQALAQLALVGLQPVLRAHRRPLRPEQLTGAPP
jgi:hypothetical protein